MIAWLAQYGTVVAGATALAAYISKLLEKHEEKATRANEKFVIETFQTFALGEKGKFWLKAYLKELLDL